MLIMRVIVFGLILLAAGLPAFADRRPNFILINCDDLGWGDVGAYGSTKHRTPHIDRLAAEGLKFTSFYSTSGVCTPSRTSLMTGCYPRRVNMHTNGEGYWVLFPGNARGLHPDEVTVAEVLKTRGYATAAIGKWHLGDQPPFLPTAQGFDFYFGIPFSNDMGHVNGRGEKTPQRPPTPLLRNDKVIETEPDQRQLTRRYTQEAIRFIEANKDGSFFLYMPHSFPHLPHYASEAFEGKSANGIYGDCIEEVDWSVGQVYEAVKRLGLDKNTMIVFMSDNGGVLRSGASNGPFKAGKASPWEGGMRVPGIFWYPGRIPAGATTDEIASQLDILPTFAALAGTEPPSDRIIDGHDLRPLLSQPDKAESKYNDTGFLYYHERYLVAVRSGPWKLFVAEPAARLRAELLDKPKLYNLDSDPGETTDVAAAHPDVVSRLMKMIERGREDIGDADQPGKNQRPAGHYENAKPLTSN